MGQLQTTPALPWRKPERRLQIDCNQGRPHTPCFMAYLVPDPSTPWPRGRILQSRLHLPQLAHMRAAAWRWTEGRKGHTRLRRSRRLAGSSLYHQAIITVNQSKVLASRSSHQHVLSGQRRSENPPCSDFRLCRRWTVELGTTLHNGGSDGHTRKKRSTCDI